MGFFYGECPSKHEYRLDHDSNWVDDAACEVASPLPLQNHVLLTAAHRKALLLGSGFVTKPTLQLLSDTSVDVTVACRTIESAKKLCEGCKNTKAISLDVNDADALDAEVAKVDGL